MKSKVAVFVLAAALAAPAAALWASAGDATPQGVNGTVTPSTTKKGHKYHHHKKAPAPVSSIPAAPGAK